MKNKKVWIGVGVVALIAIVVWLLSGGKKEEKVEFETAKVEVTKPFKQEEELDQKLDRLNELNALLNMDETGADQVEESEEVGQSKESKDKTSDKVVVRGDGRVYRSLTEAAKENYITKSAISKAIHGVRKTAGGWTWKEVEDATNVHENHTTDSQES